MLAIKQVPVDTDLQEIIKEISIMQQCDSPYVVKYYGSYFKNTDLWVNQWVSFYLLRQLIHMNVDLLVKFQFSDCDGILWRRFC